MRSCHLLSSLMSFDLSNDLYIFFPILTFNNCVAQSKQLYGVFGRREMPSFSMVFISPFCKIGFCSWPWFGFICIVAREIFFPSLIWCIQLERNAQTFNGVHFSLLFVKQDCVLGLGLVLFALLLEIFFFSIIDMARIWRALFQSLPYCPL